MKKWVLGVCVSTVLSGILMHIVPETSMKRCSGALCTVMTVAMLMLPLKTKLNVNFDEFEFSTVDNEQVQQELNQEVFTYVKNQLCNSFISELQSLGIKAENIDMVLDVQSVSNVRVEKIIIRDSLGKNDKQTVCSLAEELFESGVTVVFEDGCRQDN